MDGRNRLNQRFAFRAVSALEKDNRNQVKLRKMVLPKVQGWQSMVKPAQ
jgi:hypothetical protein